MKGALVDTNVFVYAYDPADPVKHERAVQLIDEVSGAGRLIVSAQVLNELTWILLKRQPPGKRDVAPLREVLDEILQSAQVLPLVHDLTFMALTAVAQYGLSFWDGLIWASARRHGVPLIYTEDFQHGREVEGVQFVNPFLT